MEIFVTGSTGYVGGPVMRALAGQGHSLRLLVRQGGRPPDLAGARIVAGDLADEGALAAGASGADAIVHLVGIIREAHGATFEGVHVEGTRRLLAAAAKGGVRRFVHMSANGADPASPAAYARTKAQAEALVRSSDLAWVILRPSLIYGPGGPGPTFTSEIATKLLGLPLHPIFGRGDQRLQPVHVGTVAATFAAAVTGKADGEVLSLCGPDVITMRTFVKDLAAALGRPFRPLSLPPGLVAALLPLLTRLPSFPLTEGQFRLLMAGNTASDWRRAYEILDLEPVPFRIEEAIAR